MKSRIQVANELMDAALVAIRNTVREDDEVYWFAVGFLKDVPQETIDRWTDAAEERESTRGES